ncbi:hypothetical protein INT47_003189, partial [Mucor saturninus]
MQLMFTNLKVPSLSKIQCLTFYLTQVLAKGLYTFKEIAHVRFPYWLGNLPLFFALNDIQKLLTGFE